MTSRALLANVALSTDILAPMRHFGWARACSTVAVAMRAAPQPQNGPPEAVRVMRSR